MQSDQEKQLYILAAQPWCRTTFTSVSTNSRLLAPDYENGLISHRDYVYTSTFLAAVRPYYYINPATTGIASVIATYGINYRRPMTFGRRFFLFNIIWAATNISGVSVLAAKHIKFWKNLEDPQSVAQALNNVKARLNNGAEFGAAESFPVAPVVDPSTPHPASSPSESTSHTHWDNIRSANANKASGSAWDTLRQQHERKQLPDSQTGSSQPQDDERTAAQAEFDALIERERNNKFDE